jgi:hypothetical protein
MIGRLTRKRMNIIADRVPSSSACYSFVFTPAGKRLDTCQTRLRQGVAEKMGMRVNVWSGVEA